MPEDDLLTFLSRPSLPAYVRIVLGYCEERGWPFEQAWAHTMRTIPKSHPDLEQWRAALKYSKASFKRSYGLLRLSRRPELDSQDAA